MSALTVAMMASAVASSAPGDAAINPMDLFWSACTQGVAKLPSQSSKMVEFGELRGSTKSYYGEVRQFAKFYTIGEGPSQTVLVFFENPNGKAYDHKKGCAVTAANLEVETVKAYVTGKFGKASVPDRGCKPSVRWNCRKIYDDFWYMDERFQYEIYAFKSWDNRTITQISFFDEEATKRFAELDRRRRMQK